MEGLEGYSKREAINYALIISAIVIVLRLILVYISAFVPRLLSKRIREKENSPGIKLPFAIGWAGMRGVVSLASALAIPLTLESGEDFPHRNLILFITFVVILVTLVFQGLTLPIFLKWLKIEEVDEYIPTADQMESINLRLAKASIKYLDKNYANEMDEYPTIGRIKEQLERSINATESTDGEQEKKDKLISVRMLYRKVMLEMISFRREELDKIRKEKHYDDHVLRQMEHNLDLEESRLSKQ